MLLTAAGECQSTKQGEPLHKLRIGLALALSGGAKFIGDNVQRGAELYLRQYPEFASRIETVTEDVGPSTPQGIGAVRKLIEIDRVGALILTISPVTNAVAPLIDARKIPSLAIVGDDCAKGREYMIKLWMPAGNEARAVRDYLEQKKIKRVAAVTTEQDSMLARTESLKRLLPDGAMVFEQRIMDVSELPVMAARIANLSPQAVAMNFMPGQSAILAKRLRELGYKGQLIGTAILLEPSEMEGASGALDGTVFPDSPLTDEFVRMHRREFGSHPGAGTANGYDAMKLFNQALRQFEGAAAPEELNQALRVKNFSGALGTYSFSREALNSYDLPAVMRSVNQ
ncbi:MAG: hypothetical protein DCC75_06700 [Proteobacteria bacterium]|nr:MAG: hypothetical protein DCC75_06700 [Pseudomonadota bacterium]